MLPYDPSTKVPLLIRGPGIRGRRISSEPVSNIDLAPTILRIAGASAAGGAPIDGRSLLKFAQQPTLRSQRFVLHETGGLRATELSRRRTAARSQPAASAPTAPSATTAGSTSPTPAASASSTTSSATRARSAHATATPATPPPSAPCRSSSTASRPAAAAPAACPASRSPTRSTARRTPRRASPAAWRRFRRGGVRSGPAVAPKALELLALRWQRLVAGVDGRHVVLEIGEGLLIGVPDRVGGLLVHRG